MQRERRLSKKERKAMLEASKKERELVISLGSSGPVHIAGHSAPGSAVTHMFDLDGQPISWSNGSVEMAYQTKKGRKTTSWWPLVGTDIHENPTLAMRVYDRIIAVDTNTVGSHSVAACVTLCTKTVDWENFDDGPVRVNFQTPLEFCGWKYSPERIGWHEHLRPWLYTEEYAGGARFALLVDHDLPALPAINRGDAPYIADQRLPPRVTMIYASSGHDRRMLPNRLIAMANTQAKHIARLLRTRRDLPPMTSATMPGPFERFRLWSHDEYPAGDPNIGPVLT